DLVSNCRGTYPACLVNAVGWSFDGSRIVTVLNDRTARVWEARTGREIARLDGQKDGLTTAAWNAGSTQIASASWGRMAVLWNASDGHEALRLLGHCPAGKDYGINGCVVYSAMWDGVGKRILTAATDRTARIWDARSGEQIALFDGVRSYGAVTWSG